MKPGTPHLVIVNYTSQTNRTPISSYDSSVANFRSCRNPEGRMAKPMSQQLREQVYLFLRSDIARPLVKWICAVSQNQFFSLIYYLLN